MASFLSVLLIQIKVSKGGSGMPLKRCDNYDFGLEKRFQRQYNYGKGIKNGFQGQYNYRKGIKNGFQVPRQLLY